MTFDSFYQMFLAFMVAFGNLVVGFCNDLRAKSSAVKVASDAKGMAPPVTLPAAPPPQAQGGLAPTLPHGSMTVDLTPVYIPRVPGASDVSGRITPVACDLSGATGLDSKGESYTIVGLASGDAKGRLVCRKGNRAVLRFTSDLTVVQPPAPQPPAAPPANMVPSTPVDNAAPTAPAPQPPPAPQSPDWEARFLTLRSLLEANGSPSTVAGIAARRTVDAEKSECARLNATAPTRRLETVDPGNPTKTRVTLYPQVVPSGATRVVFYQADGSPMLNTANVHHSFAVDPARCATPGSAAYKWVQGTHRLAVAVGTGKATCQYQ